MDQDFGFLIGLPVTVKKGARPYGWSGISWPGEPPVVDGTYSVTGAYIDGNIISFEVGGWWYLPADLESA